MKNIETTWSHLHDNDEVESFSDGVCIESIKTPDELKILHSNEIIPKKEDCKRCPYNTEDAEYPYHSCSACTEEITEQECSNYPHICEQCITNRE